MTTPAPNAYICHHVHHVHMSFGCLLLGVTNIASKIMSHHSKSVHSIFHLWLYGLGWWCPFENIVAAITSCFEPCETQIETTDSTWLNVTEYSMTSTDWNDVWTSLNSTKCSMKCTVNKQHGSIKFGFIKRVVLYNVIRNRNSVRRCLWVSDNVFSLTWIPAMDDQSGWIAMSKPNPNSLPIPSVRNSTVLREGSSGSHITRKNV